MTENNAHRDGSGNRNKGLAILGVVLAAALGASGCIIVDAGPTNSAPYFVDADVYAGYDTYYDQCYWDFYAYVEDNDGYNDVRDVYVDVIDLVYGGIAETFPLAYDGYGQWSDTIYDMYAGWADCNYPDDFGFDFYAYDGYGGYAYLGF